MLELAGERSAGALTYHQTPEHTARAREILGTEPVLAVEQAVILTHDREEARRAGRGHLDFYLGLPNYVNSWRRLGFTDDDFSGGGSERLIDALVLSGGADAVLEQVARHVEAGADHVCLQVLDPDPAALPERAWEEVAAALS
jgi:probable F420-dependent oxidoreductase